jgi:hypothetical protein
VADVSDQVKAVITERMNRIGEATWDRCVIQGEAASVFGWLERDDGRSDFVLLEFQWGDTKDMAGEKVTWFHAGATTSSAPLSKSISERISGAGSPHFDCQRVEDVFGDSVRRKVELDIEKRLIEPTETMPPKSTIVDE